jgi:hypothetical protein
VQVEIGTANGPQSMRISFTDQRLTAHGGTQEPRAGAWRKCWEISREAGTRERSAPNLDAREDKMGGGDSVWNRG